MDKEAMIQAAEEDWLDTVADIAKRNDNEDNVEEYNWPWFWLILAESIEWKADIHFNVIARERLSHS